MTNHKKKEENSIRKLVTKAEVLSKFVDDIQGNNLYDLESRISWVPEDQQKELISIALRFSKARKVIDYIKKEYGVTKDGKIKRKGELYDAFDIYGTLGDVSLKNLSIDLLPFALSFNIPKKNLCRSYSKDKPLPDGFVFNTQKKVLDVDLKNKQDYLSAAKSLSMFLNLSESKSSILKQHELKHVIDNITTLRKNPEFSASLFSYKPNVEDPFTRNPILDLYRDMTKISKGIDKMKQTIKRAKELGSDLWFNFPRDLLGCALDYFPYSEYYDRFTNGLNEILGNKYDLHNDFGLSQYKLQHSFENELKNNGEYKDQCVNLQHTLSKEFYAECEKEVSKKIKETEKMGILSSRPIHQINKKGLDYKTLSYIVSMTNYYNLPKSMELINDLMNIRNKISKNYGESLDTHPFVC